MGLKLNPKKFQHFTILHIERFNHIIYLNYLFFNENGHKPQKSTNTKVLIELFIESKSMTA